MKFFRYEDILCINGPHIREETFNLIKETPCGYWIGYNRSSLTWLYKPKWVSKTSRKRYAYPTKEEALNSFIARKKRQAIILENKLEIVNEVLQLAIKQKEESE